MLQTGVRLTATWWVCDNCSVSLRCMLLPNHFQYALCKPDNTGCRCHMGFSSGGTQQAYPEGGFRANQQARWHDRSKAGAGRANAHRNSDQRLAEDPRIREKRELIRPNTHARTQGARACTPGAWACARSRQIEAKALAMHAGTGASARQCAAFQQGIMSQKKRHCSYSEAGMLPAALIPVIKRGPRYRTLSVRTGLHVSHFADPRNPGVGEARAGGAHQKSPLPAPPLSAEAHTPRQRVQPASQTNGHPDHCCMRPGACQ